MDLVRQRLLESTTKQSDLIEIFAAIDRDSSGCISLSEFRATIELLNIGITSDEQIRAIFKQFDTTNNGQIDLQEFLQQLRPPMNARREQAALKLFDSVDVNKDNRLTLADLKIKYASHDKKVSRHKMDQIFRNFLLKFDTRGQEDGVIDKDEYLGFCSMLSATINEDVYFEYALRILFDLRL